MSGEFPRLRRYLAPDLSARVRWRMRSDRNPLLVTVQDKFLVRDYARERGVSCAPLLHVTADPETIPFDALPANCMIKASHGCGWNIVRSRSAYHLFGDGSRLVDAALSTSAPSPGAVAALTVRDVLATCREWLASRHSSSEWAYQLMTPRILVEHMLVPRHGPELYDLRFYTFRGQVRAINVGSPCFRRGKLNAFLWPDWSVISLTTSASSMPEVIPPRPDNLAEMLDVAGRLGRELDFVRIDLYDTSDGVVLGEMTVYPEAGTRGTPSGCPVLDGWLGSQWAMSPRTHLAVFGVNLADWARDTRDELMRRIRARPGRPRRAQPSRSTGASGEYAE